MVRTLSILKRRCPLLFFFFFFPKRRHSETAPAFFFFPPKWHRSALSQNHSSETLSHFSITLNPHSSLPLSKILTLTSLNLSLAPSHCHSLASLPRAVALRSSLSRRTSQLSLSPASPSQRSLDRSSLVVVAAQPRYDCVVLVGCDL